MKFSDYDKYIKSTGTHYISNSGHDERNKYTGGTAGDQTGEEWKLIAWYKRPWNYVLRYEKDPRVGYIMACLGCAAALNNKIGYDQIQRTTYWTQLSKVGYDPSAITTACEEDCTAGVTANAKAAGYILGIESLKNLSTSIYSGNMRTLFEKAGFTVLSESKYINGHTYLKPGDVTLYSGHHAATNVTIGKNVRSSYSIPDMTGVFVPVNGTVVVPPVNTPSTSTPSIPSGETYKVTASSLNIRKGPGTNYSVVKTVHNGDLLGKVSTNGWIPVKNKKGVLCWISAKYCNGGVVTGDSVNLRYGPSTKYKSLGTVNKGDVLELVSYTGWLAVDINGEVYWASAKYLK